MINIISKRCIYDTCTTIPIYNFPKEKTALYCNLHKLDNMIDINRNDALMNNVGHDHYTIFQQKK